jgi:hypothetical protein
MIIRTIIYFFTLQIGTASGPNYLGSCVRTQFARVLCQDPMVMGPASGPIDLGCSLRIKVEWVLRQDPRAIRPILLSLVSRPNSLWYCVSTRMS